MPRTSPHVPAPRRAATPPPGPRAHGPLAVLAAATSLAGQAHAGGFAVAHQGAEALGMASAVVARPDVSSAAFHNPALAAARDGVRVHLGALAVVPDLRVSDPASGALDAGPRQDASLVPHAYASIVHRGVGLALYAGAPYGLRIGYEPGWRGRFEVVEARLSTFAFAPSAVVRLFDELWLSGGVQVVRGAIELSRRVDLVQTEATAHLGGGSRPAVGYTLGLVGRPLRPLYLGLTVRGPVNLEFDGGADFQNVPPTFEDTLRDQRVGTAIELPLRVAGGAYYAFGDRAGVGVSAEYNRWSSSQSLEVRFEDAALSQQLPRRWRDSVTLSVGGEVRAHEWVRLRAGVYYDPAVSPPETLTPASPDSDRVGLTAGASLRPGAGLAVDVGYGLLALRERQASGEAFAARYGGVVHVLALTVGYSLDTAPGRPQTSLAAELASPHNGPRAGR